MAERDALWIFVVALGVMLVIGALLPSIAPGLIDLLNRTIIKEEHDSRRH